ncbi:hypothetical protein D3C85_1289180 [compost metagenome]
MCLSLSEKYKRNYYRLELPLGLLAVFVTIISAVKDSELADTAPLTLVFGIFVFAIWYMFATVARTFDVRSDRYSELYLLLNDMDHNKQYKRLKKEHKNRLEEESVLEEASNIALV